MSRLLLNVLIAACAAMTGGAVFAEDKIEVDSSKIIGNRELPKVLYIVPWKKPTPGDLSGRPLVSVLDEAMAPVDRDVFRRQVKYDALVFPRAAEPAGAAKAAAAPAPAK